MFFIVTFNFKKFLSVLLLLTKKIREKKIAKFIMTILDIFPIKLDESNGSPITRFHSEFIKNIIECYKNILIEIGK